MTSARIVFVTGLSGAGKSQAMKTFEDLGFYCVEHLPPAVLAETLHALEAAKINDIAISPDVHGDDALGHALEAVDRAARGRTVALLFLEARDEALVRRFSETRRRHPLLAIGSLRDAIIAERIALMPLRERATSVIDTSSLTHAALKSRIATTYAPEVGATLGVTIVAFGFKYGIPLDLDLLFDVRFLRNPNYVDSLRPLTGEDAAVASFIESDAACEPFLSKLFDMVDFLLPRYIAEGKAQLTIGIGCTGGRHRSVYVACRLLGHLGSDERLSVALDARDVIR